MTTKSPAARDERSAARLIFLDPIRVGLVALVILHHTSITYGGGGSWYYQESGAPLLTRLMLMIFTGTNQAFFMGFFFLLAGYLMPRALARKGEAAYLADRALRLGVPLLLFGYLLDPLAKALAVGAQGGNVAASLATRIGQSSFGLGPLWFNQALMIVTLAWIFLPRRPAGAVAFRWRAGLHPSIAAAVLGCGLLAFCLRLMVPVGQNVFGMQIGYFASYLILFFGGAWGASRQLLEQVTWRRAAPWLVVSLLAFPVLWLNAIVAGMFANEAWRGGWHFPALLYALWEPLVAAGVILTTLVLARRWYARERRWVTRLARASYAAFVVHAPVVVACSWLVRDLADTHLLRFLLAAPLSCLLSFVIGDQVARLFAGVLAAHARVAACPHAG